MKQQREKRKNLSEPQVEVVQVLLIMISGLLAVVTIVYLLLYIRTGIWQHLAIALSMAPLPLFYPFIRRFGERSSPDAFYRLLVLVVYEVMWLDELFHASTYIQHIITGVMMCWVLGSLLLRKGQRDWLWAILIYLAGLTAINIAAPVPRFDVNQSPLVFLVATGAMFSAIMMAVWQMWLIVRRGSIRLRLMVSFLLIALLPAAIVGGISILSHRNTAEERVLLQLDSVASLKEAEIRTWLERLDMQLASVLDVDPGQVHTNTVLDKPDLPKIVFDYSHNLLVDQISQSIGRTRLLEEIMILNAHGLVVLSTDRTQEDRFLTGDPVFQEGLEGKYISPPQYSPALRSHQIVISHPILDQEGNPSGVLAGRANIERLNGIMLERSGLGDTGQIYLVSQDMSLITVLPSGQRELVAETVGTVNAVRKQEQGVGSYDNPMGIAVLGAYRWLPELQVGLLAEVDHIEVVKSTGDWFSLTIGAIILSLILAGVLAYFVTRGIANPLVEMAEVTNEIAGGRLDRTVGVVREDEIGILARAFNSMTEQMRSTISGLEERVSERTKALERRSVQLQVAAEVARDITTAMQLNQMLDQAVHLIRDRFAFYHAGIFLVDNRGEYAVLRAATGDAGIKMLELGHKLKVGAVGIVGDTTSSGKPHIALDVGQDPAHFRNPLLPYTRSEMALPLRSGGRVIGALDVQSIQEAAFDQDDVTVLQTLADQLAVAIENTRLLEEMNRTVRELEQAYGRYTRESWREYLAHNRHSHGYRYQHIDVVAATDKREEADQALREGRTVVHSREEDGTSSLAVPINLRGEVLGVLNLRFEQARIGQNMIALVQEAADRLAFVLENTRLLYSAQRQAVREQQINLITGEVRRSTRVESILQSTVLELGKALGASRTFIHIGAPIPREEASRTRGGDATVDDTVRTNSPTNGGQAHRDQGEQTP